MKTIKLFYIMACLFSMVIIVPRQTMAQNRSAQVLYIIYIDHEVATPVKQLTSHLQSLYERCEETGNAMIVYLSDGEESLISLLNLEDPLHQGRDRLEAFEKIVAALQNNNFHRVNVKYDRSAILKLFDDFNITNDQAEIQFRSVTFDFHIGPEFWQLHYNEKIIAPLYMSLGVSDFPINKFSFNVLRPQGIRLEYPEGQPFGISNFANINNKIIIKEFVSN